MRHHAVEANRTCRMFRIDGLGSVLMAVLGILARDIAPRDPSATARAPLTELQQTVLMQ